jgi:hypothetical protein
MIYIRMSILVFLFSLCSHHAIYSQINIKVGYGGSFPQKLEVNKVISTFNNSIGKSLEDKMDEITSLNGLTLGLRYRWKKLGIDASWQSLSSKSDFVGNISGQPTQIISDKWFISDTDYSLGLENYFGNFGYGASFGISTLRIKTDIEGASRKKRTVTEETAPFGRFYLIFQASSSIVAACIKPYIQFPLGKTYDISSFALDLNKTYDPSYQIIDPIESRQYLYGVTIALYNGPQE